MTDPKDAPPKWPDGLNKVLKEMGCNNLREAIAKKMSKPIEAKPVEVRLPYADKEPDLIPD
jgi:hypothetical protein